MRAGYSVVPEGGISPDGRASTSSSRSKRWPQLFAASSWTRFGQLWPRASCIFPDSCRSCPHPGLLLRCCIKAAAITGSPRQAALWRPRTRSPVPGHFTHRIAISNQRLVELREGKVSFRWRDSANKTKKRILTLPVEEFLRRFFLHVLPDRFVRIRHFGFMANRQRQHRLAICRKLLNELPQPTVDNAAADACSSNDF
jgi:hypothetical protein